MKGPSDLYKKLSQIEKGLKKKFLSDLKNDYELKTKVLGGNTARAYSGNQEYTPSSMVKNWLHSVYLKEGSPTLNSLLIGNDFDKIHKEALVSLKKYWKKWEPDVMDMEFYRFAKIIDLFFKSVTRWSRLSEARRNWFFNHAYVPLDKYSLIALELHHPDFKAKKKSMGNIENENHYKKIQGMIKELVTPYSPLLFDLYAWDYLRPILIKEDDALKAKQETYNRVSKSKLVKE